MSYCELLTLGLELTNIRISSLFNIDLAIECLNKILYFPCA
jgi:hypothetical protein